MDEETNYRQHVAILLQYWWVFGIVFLVVLGVTIYISSLATAQYQTSVRLLINTSSAGAFSDDETIVNFPLVIHTSRRPSYIFSGSTLSALATRADLVQEIISEIDLRDDSGHPWVEGDVQGMLSPEVEIGESAGDNPTFPLLTMTISGDDPEVVKGVAGVWSDLFMERLTELISRQATDFYNFVNNQHTAAEDKLYGLVSQRDVVLVENSIYSQGREGGGLEYSLTSAGMEAVPKYQNDEFELIRAILTEQKAVLLVKSAQIQIGEAEYDFLVEELATAGGSQNEHQGIYERMVDRKADLEYNIKTEMELVVAYQEVIEANQGILDNLHEKNATIVSELHRLDREIAGQRIILDKLSNELGEAQFVMDGLPGSVTLIGPAGEPNLPPQAPRSKLVIGVILGVIFGVLAAFAVHYARDIMASRELTSDGDVEDSSEGD